MDATARPCVASWPRSRWFEGGRWRGRLAAGALVVMASAPSPARASPPSAAVSPEEARERDLLEAERLYRAGRAKYSAARYDAAILDFEGALELVSAHDLDPEIELALLVNLARTHRRFYEVDPDLKHLRTALALFRRILPALEVGSDGHVEAEAAIAELESVLEPAPTAGPGGADDGSASPGRDRRMRPAGTGWFVAAGVGGAIGLAGAGLLTYGLVLGARQERRGREAIAGTGGGALAPQTIDEIDRLGQRGNTLAIVGGVVTGVGVAGAVAFGWLGARARKRAQPHVALTPWLGSAGAGLTIGGGF